MKKMVFVTVITLILSLSVVAAISQQEIGEAKNLIGSKINCKDLSDSQLEIIGEYYMEQMHPGEAHELMHKMMGLEEGSQAEEQFHINLAKTIYCNERGAFGMMGSGMMGNYLNQGGQGFAGPAMMGYNAYNPFDWWVTSTLYTVLLVGLIVLVALGIMKLWKDLAKRKA